MNISSAIKYLPSGANILSNAKLFRSSSYSAKGDEIAKFSYRTHRSIKCDIALLHLFHLLEEELLLSDAVISRFITSMEIGDYIEWTSKYNHKYSNACIYDLLVFAITDCYIKFRDCEVEIEAGQLLRFSPEVEYSVDSVKIHQSAIVWLIPQDWKLS